MWRPTACPRLLIPATIVAILGACADVVATPDHVAPPADSAARPGALAKLRIVSGDSQVASLSAPAPRLLRVRATDAFGNPLAGVSVTFAVASGGGDISGSPVLTDDSGVAASSVWTLGSAEGPQHVIARAAAYELTFTAFARPLPPPDPPELSAGERLVYVRNGAIWEATGSQQRLLLQLAAGIYAAAVARDGSIAFVTSTSNQVCIAASDEPEPRCVSPGYYNINGLAWSPNGTQLVFSGQPVLSSCSATPPCISPRTELLAVDAATMIVRPVVVGIRGVDALGPSWSPDGSVIAFANRGGIWLVNADGTQPRELTPNVGGAYAVMRVRWSPDGRKFSVSLWDESNCPWYCDSAVGSVDADGSGLRVLATASVATGHFVGSWSHGAPFWSPDGQRIAFGRSDCSAEWDPCGEDVSVVDANGGTPKPLLNNGTLLAWHER